MAEPKAAVRALPLAITPRNADALLGVSWDTARRSATRHGIPLLRFGRIPALDAQRLLAALTAEAEQKSASGIGDAAAADPVSAALTALGLRRRAGCNK